MHSICVNTELRLYPVKPCSLFCSRRRIERSSELKLTGARDRPIIIPVKWNTTCESNAYCIIRCHVWRQMLRVWRARFLHHGSLLLSCHITAFRSFSWAVHEVLHGARFLSFLWKDFNLDLTTFKLKMQDWIDIHAGFGSLHSRVELASRTT